jgi:dihydrodipicolinate synthase/N-acetylneuraminate lyase
MTQTSSASIMVPTLTLKNRSGGIDRTACLAYAQQASKTWIDLFMLSGSIGEGFALSPRERREVLEAWLEYLPNKRLLACVWNDDDFGYLQRLQVRPVVVLRSLADQGQALQLFENIPQVSYVYSHPVYTRTTLTATVAEAARNRNILPAGAKVSKVSLEGISSLRAATGDSFALYDGRSRHIEESISAGATGVVVVPLCVLPEDLPDKNNLKELQSLINDMQKEIDSIDGVPAQANMLAGKLRKQL